MFLWMLLACVIGYEQSGGMTTLSIEQTNATQYYYYEKAIKSSLKILSIDKDGLEVGHGSGNYFSIGQHKFIISAAHIIEDGLDNVVQEGDFRVKLQVVKKFEELDIVILMPGRELKTTKAVDYRTTKKLDITGDAVVYAGYPAELDKSVFNGSIASSGLTSLMMQSFALPGASGSVVFDNKGMVVGVLSAIKIGYSNVSPFPQLHPGLVFVNRLRNHDRYILEEIIVKWKSSQ